MRFLYVLTQKSTPQWAQCYYDYEINKKLIGICRKAISIQSNIMDMTGQNSDHLIQESDNGGCLLSQVQKKTIYQTSKSEIQIIVDQANSYFFQYHSLNKQIVYLFLQMKVHELKIRFAIYSQWSDIKDIKTQILSTLISNCFNQNRMLNTMAEVNLEAYRKIVKKHRKVFSRYSLPTPMNRTSRINRSLREIKQQTDSLQGIYATRAQLYPRQARAMLGDEIQDNKISSSLAFYLLGLFNGFSLAAFIASHVLIIINLNQSIVFSVEHRIWKYLAFIILYLWVFGITFQTYEKKRINYNLIFNFQSHENKSKKLLQSASVISLLFVIFFAIYILEKSQIISVPYPQALIIAFPATMVGIFIVLAVLRFFIIRTKSSAFFLQSLGSVFNCFFPSKKITFVAIWATQQLISLVQMWTDLAYGICYYSHSEDIKKYFDSQKQSDPCFFTLRTAQIYGIIIFSIRALQSIRKLFKQQSFIRHEFLILIRSTLSIIICGMGIGLSVLSQISNQQNIDQPEAINIENQIANLRPILITLIVISIIYSYSVDILQEWQLVQVNIGKNQNQIEQENRSSKGFINFRKRNQLHPTFYKIILFMNLIFRCGWILCFCPHILYSYTQFAYPETFIALATFLELCRRGVWNLLRVENQHIKNCNLFRVKTDYEQKESMVDKQLQKIFGQDHDRTHNKQMKDPQRKLEVKRNVQQIRNVRYFLGIKEEKRKKIMQWIIQNENKLIQIQKKVSEQISK